MKVILFLNLFRSSKCLNSYTSQVLSSTSTSALGASFWIITLISLINPASIASLWGMINQAQLFFLILLTKAFIPLDVQNVITGAKFALNIASYIFVPSYVFLGSITEQFDFSLSDKSLNYNNWNKIYINGNDWLSLFFTAEWVMFYQRLGRAFIHRRPFICSEILFIIMDLSII